MTTAVPAATAAATPVGTITAQCRALIALVEHPGFETSDWAQDFAMATKGELANKLADLDSFDIFEWHHTLVAVLADLGVHGHDIVGGALIQLAYRDTAQNDPRLHSLWQLLQGSLVRRTGMVERVAPNLIPPNMGRRLTFIPTQRSTGTQPTAAAQSQTVAVCA